MRSTSVSDAKLKKKNWKKRIGLFFIVILVGWLIIYLFPVSERQAKPFFAKERPLVIAHQGGEHLAPSNTLAAFQLAMELGVDVIEFDIHMTKDGHLVAIHDNTVDRTTNGKGRVNDLTLEEIKQLDAADYFQDLHGEYRYRGQGVTIPTVKEIFENIPNMKWNIEIKATNDPELYQPMAEKLWAIMQEYGLEDDVLVASFEQDIIDMMAEVSQGRAAISGGRQEVTKFVILHKLFLNGLYQPQVDAIQIPTEESIFNLKDSKLIKGAKQRGLDLHYWTINDQEKIQELIDLGADAIITDRPDLLLNLLN